MIMRSVVSFLRKSVDGIMGIWLGKKRDMARLGARRYSWVKKRMQRMVPMVRGRMTMGEDQAYWVPPHCVARIMQPTPRMNVVRPGQSMIVRPDT